MRLKSDELASRAGTTSRNIRVAIDDTVEHYRDVIEHAEQARRDALEPATADADEALGEG
jgi:hypothetical protein